MPLFGIHGGKYRAVISTDSRRAVYDGAAVRVVLCRRQRMDDGHRTQNTSEERSPGAAVYDSTNNPHVRK